MKHRFAALLALALILCLTASASPIEHIRSGDPAASFGENDKLLTIRFMNTHAASDSFLLTYDGMTMLIDCGTAEEARAYLVPHLQALGITEIDCVVNTHPHDDHLDGFVNFAEAFPIGALYTCFPLDVNKEQKRAVAAAEAHGIPVISLNDQDTIPFSDLEIRTFSYEDKSGLNCASLIMHIRCGDSALLLLADSEGDAQKRLNMLWGETLKCDIVKLPHHGINLPSYSMMQNALPELAVITNRYSARCDKSIGMAHNVRCAEIRFTCNGDVICVTDGTRWVAAQEWE